MNVEDRELLQRSLDALEGLVLNPESNPLVLDLRKVLEHEKRRTWRGRCNDFNCAICYSQTPTVFITKEQWDNACGGLGTKP